MNRYSGGIIVVMFLAAVVSAGCEKVVSGKQEPVRLVRTVKVSVAPVVRQLSFAGQVKARYESTLAFRVGGKLIGRSVEVGSVVQPGQMLARLDATDLQLAVQAANAELSSAESDRKLAALNFKRYGDLRKKGLISQADYDRQQTLLNAAEGRAVAARAHLEQAQNQVNYAKLVADAPGVVTALLVEVGQVVAPAQPVLMLDRSGEREVMISVPEQQLDVLRDAQAIGITLWSNPAHRYTGTVREIAPRADPLTRTYTAKIAVPDADADLQSGMTATAVIDLPVEAGRITLPLSVLYTKNAQPNVWVVDPGKHTVKLVPVETAGMTGEDVIIRAGLRPGDIVVSAGANLLVPGQVVKLEDAGP